MLVDFGKASLIAKARQQPDKVRMVIDKIRTDGLLSTISAVKSKLDQPLAMGYCNVGEVLEIGQGVLGWQAGDRIASNGKHAEVVAVPVNLCAKVPDAVTDEAAVFTVLASIGLQGIRLAQPTLGEAFVVTGLGLIGLMTVQLLRAHGCKVLGIDKDHAKILLAREFGAETVDLSIGEDPIAISAVFSKGRGVDGVLITASTDSSEPVHQAAQMCRKRGRIVLVGVTGLELSRADFYEKELSFQVSCSYGPGRYDRSYEDRGNDYPFGLVRWTEQRNFEAVLDMFAAGSLAIDRLISHRFPIDRATDAYELLTSTNPSMGILLEYKTVDSSNSHHELLERTILFEHKTEPKICNAVLGLIGSGNYASQVLVPAITRTPARLKIVASSGGVSGTYLGRKFGFEQTTTDVDILLTDTDINTIVITTRHDTHARYVCEALRAGKNVFVEKPLALTLEEVAEIDATYQRAHGSGKTVRVMIGFNRRFAPQVKKIKGLLSSIAEPKAVIITVNAGAIPPDHWTHDPDVGGGRVVGEACHFVDLARFLVGQRISGVQVTTMGVSPSIAVREDKLSFTMTFEDGSLATVHYLANGHKSFPKERIEVFCAGRILQLDNFRKLSGYGWPQFRKLNLWQQDKGQRSCIAEFIHAIQVGEDSPIPWEEILEVSRRSCEIAMIANVGS